MWITLAYHMTDGLQQVRLTKTNRAVNEIWVIGTAGILGDGHCRGVRQPVARPRDKVFESIIGTEAKFLIGIQGRLKRPFLIREDFRTKPDRYEPSGGRLGRFLERNAAMLVQIACLGRILGHDFQHPVLEVAGLKLSEPASRKRWMR